MSDQIKWKHVGKVKEAHALKGELYILIFAKEWSWQKELKSFLLKGPKGDTLELKSVRSKPHKDGLILKPEGVDDRNQSEKLVGYEFHIPQELLVSKKGDTIFLAEILGFTVFNQAQEVGLLKDFSSNGPQDLLVIESTEQVCEVPFVSEFIVKIDFQNKRIILNLPEGLLEINKK